MTTRKPAQNLVTGDLIDHNGPRMVAQSHNYGNGWWVLFTEDGEAIDCLAFAMFDVLL